MRVLVGLFLVSCWMNPTIIKVQPTTKYIHDLSKNCESIPKFPPIIELSDPQIFVDHLDNWIQAASGCLDVSVYCIHNLLDVKTWTYP